MLFTHGVGVQRCELKGLLMPIFASPDFGATGVIVLVLFLVWAGVLILASVGIALGLRLLGRGSAKSSWYGVLLVTVSTLIPLSCCIGPSQIFRMTNGSYPIGSYPTNIQKGMSFDEVTAIIGPPHRRSKRGEEECWYYSIDALDIEWFGCDFGPDGLVVRTYGN
jgi:hypothetical protein